MIFCAKFPPLRHFCQFRVQIQYSSREILTENIAVLLFMEIEIIKIGQHAGVWKQVVEVASIIELPFLLM
jgi:hypothetical protein